MDAEAQAAINKLNSFELGAGKLTVNGRVLRIPEGGFFWRRRRLRCGRRRQPVAPLRAAPVGQTTLTGREFSISGPGDLAVELGDPLLPLPCRQRRIDDYLFAGAAFTCGSRRSTAGNQLAQLRAWR